MGVDLKDLIPKKEVTLEDLNGRSVAVDAYNTLYQFLAIIRQPTGEPLTDREGRITSHLSGLLYRNSNLIEKGIQLVYVFDGKSPSLKEVEVKRRRTIKDEAFHKYGEAVKQGNFEEARTYAQMTSQLKDSMVGDAKKLLSLMGIPWVQAPSEGEAQAAHMTRKGDVWATASQDYDSLLFGSTRLVRNLTITGRRKLPRKDVYVEVFPEIIELQYVTQLLNVTLPQLVDIGILIGTDFNPDGVRGIGPKTALKLITEHGALEKVLPQFPEAEYLTDKLGIRNIFLKPETTDKYEIKWAAPDVEGIMHFLCDERDFSEERIKGAIGKITSSLKEMEGKTTLESWFK
ncbi:MAG: flap endonuclease-1 [Candidatus Bathyarchaeota archaeon]